jgi:ribokinase
MSRIFVPRIFVLGNASLDTTLRVPRLPAPGETLMATGILRSPGGKGLNQAVVAARAGAEVRFLAPLGTEPETALIRDTLAAEGLHALWAETGAPTDLSSLMVAPDGENCIVSTGACCDSLGHDHAEPFLAALRPGDLLLMQGNLRLEVTLAAAQAARRLGARVMLNTAPLRWDYAGLLPLCDLVVANRFEARTITGEADPQAAALALGGTAIVTLGAQGCLLADPALHRFPAVEAQAIDTTGAGDVFCGTLAAAWAQGALLPGAIAAAQRAAAISVTREGCFGSFPTKEESKHVLF